MRTLLAALWRRVAPGLLAAFFAAGAGAQPFSPSISQINAPSGFVLPGATYTVTATVSSSGPQPTGAVAFVHLDGSGLYNGTHCNTTLLGGQAVCTFVTTASNANWFLRIDYAGDVNTQPGQLDVAYTTLQATPSFVVSGAPSGTILPFSPQNVNVTVTSPGPTPTGAIAFILLDALGNNNGTHCNLTLAGGSATCAFLAPPSNGNWFLRISYGGDVPTEPLIQDLAYTTLQATPGFSVSGVPSGTILPNSSQTVNVTVTSPGPTPTGPIAFVLLDALGNNNGTHCNQTLSGGSASCSFLAPTGNASWSLRISYGGDTPTAPKMQDYPYSTLQATPSFVVSGVPSGNVLPGSSQTVNLTVTSPGPTPSGAVAFSLLDALGNNNGTHCNATLLGGSATCSFSAPATTANWQLRISYAGDTPTAPKMQDYPYATSQATPSFVVTGAPSGSVLPGAAQTVNITVTSPGPTPTGAVNFSLLDALGNNNGTHCNTTLAGGFATCSFSAPAANGNWQLRIAYAGDTPTAPKIQDHPYTVSNQPVVTNTNNSGTGSLRDAINFVNGNCAGQTITFNIPPSGVVHTIQPTSQLPAITCSNVTIDGYTQPGSFANGQAIGWAGNILIEVNGDLAPGDSGFVLNAATTRIQGLAINGFANGYGILITAPFVTPGAEILGNLIGLAPDGTTVKTNYWGIGNVPGATGLSAGFGSNPAYRNVISGSWSYQIYLVSGNGTYIGNNLIGTDASGAASASPNGQGIYLEGTSNTTVEDNVVSGNAGGGIDLSAAANTTVRRNLVGMSADGATTVPNVIGMRIINLSSPTFVGGNPADGNVVSGNLGDGIYVTNSTAHIHGNRIGTNASGASSLGNGGAGILMDATSSGVIGSNTTGNIITNNQHGVVALGNAIEISGNSIYDNADPGINLLGVSFSTVPPNDACDVDGGGNGLANFPVLSAAALAGGVLVVTGTHNTTPSTTFRLEFFSSPAAEGAANRSGKTYLGFFTVTTDGACNATFAGTVNAAPAGEHITATSTDPSGNTSSFSNAVVVGAGTPAPTIAAIRPTTVGAAGGAAIEIEGADLGTSPSVTIGGLPVSIINISGTSLTVLAPIYTPGSVPVVVTTPGGSVTAGTSLTFVADDDAARDFSALNPGPRWSYGFAPARGGAFTAYGSLRRASGLDYWAAAPGGLPEVRHNYTTATVVSATNAVPAGGLALHPGNGGENSVVRWTAPAAGSYSVSGNFTGIDFSFPTTVDAAVLRNNNAAAPLFAENVFDYNVAHPFAFNVSMAAGETLEFTVGHGGNGYAGDAVQLSAVVTPVAAAPALTLSASSLMFGPQLNGTVAPPQTVTITNTGTSTLTFSSIGTGSASFPNTPTCTTTLAPGSSCDVAVTFTSPTTGNFPGTLTIVSDAPGSPHTVALSGESVALPTPGISFSPPSLAFGSQTIGTMSPSQDVVVTNTGTATLTISSIAISPDFVVTGCTTISAGANCKYTVVFTPSTTGPINGALTLASNAPGSPHTVPLTGTGTAVPAPALSLTPPTLNFASRTLSTTSPAQIVTLSNSGDAPLDIRSITVSGDYAFTSACPVQLAALASCTIDVTFTPLVAGPRAGAVSIATNASGSPHAVSLTGTGASSLAPGIAASPPLLDFAANPVGSDSAAQIVAVTNTGTATLTFGAIAVTGDYRQVSLPAGTTGIACPVDLAPGATCKIAIVFHPNAVNLRSGVLSITTNAGSAPTTVSLAGTGLTPAAPQLSVAASLSFDHQPVGTKSTGKALAIKNTSTSLATITDLSAGGDFSVSDTCTTIAAGATCSPLVFFQPTETGPRTGTLTIRTLRDADPYLVALDGIGDENRVPVLELSATRVGFGNAFIGSATRVRLTLRNIGQVPLLIESVLASGSYIVTHACPVIPPTGTCTLEITFLPGMAGGQGGAVEIRSNAQGSPHRIDLTGVGCFIPSPSVLRRGLLLCGN